MGKYEGVAHDELPCVLSKFWDAVKHAEDNNMVPTVVTEKEINDRLESLRIYYSGMTPEKRKENQGFGIGHGLLDESEYWQIQNKARLINITIPTLEDFGKEVDVEPNYDCNTGYNFTKETDIPIINPLGWESQDAYENERIPWIEYCSRRVASDCDYTKFHAKRCKYKDEWIIVGDAQPGERIKIYTGSCHGKTATVLKKVRNMVTIRVDGKEHDNAVCATNRAKRIRE